MSKLKTLLTLFCFIVIQGTKLHAQATYNPGTLDNIVQSEQKAYGILQLNHATRYSPTNHITYARFNWYIQPGKDTISGKVSYVYKVLNIFDTLVLNLNDTLWVDSVYYHNTSGGFVHKNNLLKMSTGSSIVKGAMDSITVYYHGHPTSKAGFGSFVNSIHGSHNDSVLWTLSEPYGASDWWPCKNDLSDKIDSCDIFITTPDRFIASANGSILSQGTDGRYNYFHFKMHYPVATYLIGIAASNYTYFDTSLTLINSHVNVTQAVYPEDFNYFYTYQWQVIQALHLYDSLYGAYPFSKDRYGVTEFGWGGGMEHQTNVFVHDYSFELNVHEMAHQWFGDKITLGSWQDIWLNEGWAVYSSYLCYEYLLNGYWWPLAKQGMIGKVISVPDGSVRVDDTTSVDRIFSSRLSYKKGAALLHMLRWEVGDSAFFSGVRSYVSDTNLCYKFALTQQFKDHIQTSSGKNLDTFFDQWYAGQGFPNYKITYAQSGSAVTIHIKQTTSHPSVPVYNMHLPIKLKSLSGKDTMLRLWNNDSSATYTIPSLSFTIDSLIFDPDYWIVAGNHAAHPNSVGEINNMDMNIKLYPSPANDWLYVYHAQEGTVCHIYDMIGNCLLSKNINLGDISEKLDLSGLPSGGYIFQFITLNGQTISKPFIKQ